MEKKEREQLLRNLLSVCEEMGEGDLYNGIGILFADYDVLEKQNQQDKQRLDWLESKFFSMIVEMTEGVAGGSVPVTQLIRRSTIDAAMKIKDPS